jgi:predicted hotdog family 3-hydroxylacyl-ACP dehydratase
VKSAYQVEDLVPHSGKMSLLSRIVEYGEGWLQSEVDITGESLFADDRGVPAWIGMEYMAQTIAAYAGLQERNKGGAPKIGFLLGARKYSSSTDYFARGQTFRVRVELEMVAENGLNVFNCKLEGNNARAEAVVNVFQPDDAEKFLEEATS